MEPAGPQEGSALSADRRVTSHPEVMNCLPKANPRPPPTRACRIVQNAPMRALGDRRVGRHQETE
jgi:hypothetical protein